MGFIKKVLICALCLVPIKIFPIIEGTITYTGRDLTQSQKGFLIYFSNLMQEVSLDARPAFLLSCIEVTLSAFTDDNRAAVDALDVLGKMLKASKKYIWLNYIWSNIFCKNSY